MSRGGNAGMGGRTRVSAPRLRSNERAEVAAFVRELRTIRGALSPRERNRAIRSHAAAFGRLVIQRETMR